MLFPILRQQKIKTISVFISSMLLIKTLKNVRHKRLGYIMHQWSHGAHRCQMTDMASQSMQGLPFTEAQRQASVLRLKESNTNAR